MSKPQPLDALFVLVTESDEKLMEYVQRGNQKAFSKIYEKYKQRIFGFIMNMVNDKNIAQDLSHDVFLKVMRKADQYSQEYKFSTWIFSIARNTTLDYFKKKSEITFGLDTEENQNWIDQAIDPHQDVEMQAIQRAEKDIVRKCLQSLKAEHKDVLLMRIYSELNYEEIAQTMGKSLSSIKSLINRAKAALDQCVMSCMESI